MQQGMRVDAEFTDNVVEKLRDWDKQFVNIRYNLYKILGEANDNEDIFDKLEGAVTVFAHSLYAFPNNDEDNKSADTFMDNWISEMQTQKILNTYRVYAKNEDISESFVKLALETSRMFEDSVNAIIKVLGVASGTENIATRICKRMLSDTRKIVYDIPTHKDSNGISVAEFNKDAVERMNIEEFLKKYHRYLKTR